MIDLQAEPAAEVHKLSVRSALSKAISLRPSRAIAWLLSINIAVRGLWLLYMHPPQHVDFLWYYTHAVQMAEGLGYIQGGAATAYWPAGYPFFLSLLFRVFEPSVIFGMVANALLSAGIVMLVYALATRLTGDRRIAFWSALAYTLLPSQIAWNSVLGSEELATFLLVWSILLYPLRDQSKRYVATALSGLVMGLGCDVRPIPLLFPFFIFFLEKWIWGRKGAASTKTATIQMMVYGVALLVGVCPLTIRNWIDFHHLILVSNNGGVNLWQGTMTDTGYYWSWHPDVNPLLAAGANTYLENQIGMHAFFEHVIHHPYWTFFNGFAKWFYLYWKDDNVMIYTFRAGTATMQRLAYRMGWIFTVVYWLWMAVAVTGMAWGMKICGVRWRRLALPVVFIAYNTEVFFVFPAWDRFRYPIMPLYALFVGVGVVAWLRHREGRKAARSSAEVRREARGELLAKGGGGAEAGQETDRSPLGMGPRVR